LELLLYLAFEPRIALCVVVKLTARAAWSRIRSSCIRSHGSTFQFSHCWPQGPAEHAADHYWSPQGSP